MTDRDRNFSLINRRRFLNLTLGAAVAPWTLPAMASSPFATLDETRIHLASVHAHVVDLSNGSTLYSKFADEVVPVASLTKLMTALVIMESGLSLDEWVEFVERDRPAPVNAYSRIRIGSEAPRRELLRMALTASENFAAHVLARQYPGDFDGFVRDMNRKARDLGMISTRFVDPSGLSQNNLSTARDMSRLVAAAHDHSDIRHLSTDPGYTVRFRQPRYSLRFGNTNNLVHSPHWDVTLTKTGYLDASGRCLAMAATIRERPVSMVFLDAFGRRTPIGDAGRVRRWLQDGAGGRVSGPSLAYERRKRQELEALQKARSR